MPEKGVVAGPGSTVPPDRPLDPRRPRVVGRQSEKPALEPIMEGNQVVQRGLGGRVHVEALVHERVDLKPKPPGGLGHQLPKPGRPRRRNGQVVVVRLDEGEIAKRGRQAPSRQFGGNVVLVPAHSLQTAPDRTPPLASPMLQPPGNRLLDQPVTSRW